MGSFCVALRMTKCSHRLTMLRFSLLVYHKNNLIASNFFFGGFSFPFSVYKSVFHSPSAEVQITARCFSTPLSHWYALYIL